jgi:hypothetical protein
LAGPWLTVQGDHVQGVYTTVDQHHVTVQNSLKDQLSQNRYAFEVGGGFVTLSGEPVLIPTDRVNRDLWTAMVAAGLTTVNYKVHSDRWLTLSQADIQLVAGCLINMVQTLYNWEKNVVDEINNTTDLAQLAMIDIKSGPYGSAPPQDSSPDVVPLAPAVYVPPNITMIRSGAPGSTGAV